MSNFKETFTRTEGAEGNLQYDDTAFKYFILAVMCSINIPLFILIIKPIFFNPAKKKYSNPCSCEHCKTKYKNLGNQQKYDFISKRYFIFIVIFFTLIYIIDNTITTINP